MIVSSRFNGLTCEAFKALLSHQNVIGLTAATHFFFVNLAAYSTCLTGTLKTL